MTKSQKLGETIQISQKIQLILSLENLKYNNENDKKNINFQKVSYPKMNKKFLKILVFI